MHAFDPDKVRDQLYSEIGIEFNLAPSLNDVTKKNAVTGHADAMLDEGIRCHLVRYHDPGRQLLGKAKEWFEYAIADDERPRVYFHGGTEAHRHESLALCNWLLEDRHDSENLKAAVECRDLYYRESGIDKTDLLLTLPVYVDAREYEKAIALFECTPRLKAPTNIQRISSEGRMAYAIAAARARSEFSESEIETAIDRFLRRQVPRLLADGQYPSVARWMKIAFWNNSARNYSPEEVLLKCYDYLEDSAPPPPQ